jgi:hypothetical protein
LMSTIAQFEKHLPRSLQRTFRSLRSPAEIQRYLDRLPYVGENRDRCPLDVMRDEQCHCLDGALMAAVALRHIGDPGLLVDLVPAHDRRDRNLDDDHVLAVFRRHGAWGAIAKSNYAWLRYREPVYRSLRELAMSYFEVYFSLDAVKSLRGYTRPLDISLYDRLDYAWSESGAAKLYRRLYERKMIPLVSEEAESQLQAVDQRAYDSGSVGVDVNWVYRPPKRTATK